MCLTEVTKSYAIPNKKESYGYKVFIKYPKEKFYRFDCWVTTSPISIKSKKWHRSTDGPIPIIEPDYLSRVVYERGFHVFANKKDAKIWLAGGDYNVIVRVKIRGITARGIQRIYSCDLRVVVAKEMKIEGIV